MLTTQTAETKAVLTHHLESAFAGDIEAVLSDYSEDSVIYLPQGPIRGLTQIRKFFTDFLGSKPKDSEEAFEMLRQDFVFLLTSSPKLGERG